MGNGLASLPVRTGRSRFSLSSIFTFLSLMKPYLNAYILVDEGVTSSSTVLPTNSTVCLPSILQETRRKASKVKQVIWNEILKLTAVK